jgi:CRP-like cAMP-binding protein
MNAMNYNWAGPPLRRSKIRPELFQGLTLTEMRRTRKRFDECLLADGEALPRDRHGLPHVALVKEGTLREDVAAPHGGTRLFALTFAGETLPPPGPRHKGSLLRAVGTARILTCSREVFTTLVTEVPRLQINLLQVVQDQIAEVHRWQTLLGRKTAAERIASILTWFHARQGSPNDVILPISRGELGELSGMTVETVSRQIRRLEKAGLIALPKRNVVRLLDVETLLDRSEGAQLPRAA